MSATPRSRRRIPSLNWLRVFEAAARTQSFARAAEQLFMSPPAVSQQIRALEGHLGQALFERAPRHVTLTDAGRAFLPVVQQSLASVETTAAALFGPDGQEAVSLQAVTILAMSWLPARLARFETENPGSRVHLTTGNILDDFRHVLPAHAPQLQIVFASPADLGDHAEWLFGETLYPVAHRNSAAKLRQFDDLAGHRLFEVSTHRSGWYQLLAEQSAMDLANLRISFADHTPMALMMAAQQLGIALARAPASDAMVQALGLVPLEFCTPIQGTQGYYLLTSESGGRSRTSDNLKAMLLEEACKS